MIFLLKNHKYKIISPEISPKKLLQKYTKYQSDLAAVLVECSTKMRSDVYTIIDAKHFKAKVDKMEITYSIAFTYDDEPICEDNTMTRTLSIETALDLYNISSLFYQLNKNHEIVGMSLPPDARATTIVAIFIHNKRTGDKYEWNQQENVIEFLERQNLICDTDDFLDASVPKEERFEQGLYYTRYDRNSHSTNMSYYYYDRKSYLYLAEGSWYLSITAPDVEIENMQPQHVSDTAVGFCITGTGLVYMASLPVAINLMTVGSIDVYITQRGHPSSALAESTCAGYNILDLLYIALYLPQMIDINRYLFDINPYLISCVFLIGKRNEKSGSYKFPLKSREDEGLSFDLFAMIAFILISHYGYYDSNTNGYSMTVTTLHDISFDD